MIFTRTLTRLAAALLLCSPAISAPATGSPATPVVSTEERLTRLEQRFEALAEENRQLREQLAALRTGVPAAGAVAASGSLPASGPSEPAKAAKPAPLYVAAAGKEQKLTLGGFMHVNGELGGAPDARWNGTRDRILLRRARLNAAGSFAENVAFKIEADFGANSLSARSGINAQLTDGYVDWTPLPALSLRVGQFKTPFGYEQLTPDTRTATVERSLPNDRLTIGRQPGIGASGKLGSTEAFTYSVGLFNGTGANTSTNDNDNFLAAGRVAATILGGRGSDLPVRTSLGLNAYRSRDTGTFNGDRDGLGLDAQFAHDLAELNLEWLQSEADPRTGATTTAAGWASLLVLNLHARWQGAIRYETYDSNTDTAGSTSETWTLGATYRIRGDDLKFTLNYLIGDPATPLSDDSRLIGRMQIVF